MDAKMLAKAVKIAAKTVVLQHVEAVVGRDAKVLAVPHVNPIVL
jgi:hypothetical protein